MYSVCLLGSTTAGFLKVNFHSLPFFPSTASTLSGLTADHEASSLPAVTSACLRWSAQPLTTDSVAALAPWKWQLLPLSA